MADPAPPSVTEFVARFWPQTGEMPKHLRLHRAFSDAILSGFWPAGARLPTEAELVAATPCSLGTIQRALRGLTQDGLIARRRGSGSVVADSAGRLKDPWHIRYLSPDGGQAAYLPLSTRVLSRARLKATDRSDGADRWGRVLGADSGPVIKIDRLFSADDAGTAIQVYSEFYAAEARFPDFLTMPVARLNGMNFKEVFGQQQRTPISRVHQSLRFAVPPDHVRAYLPGAPSDPIAVLNVVAHAPHGEAIYYQDFHLPPTMAELDLGMLSGHGTM